MNDELWSNVDRYLTELLLPSDPVLDAALEDSQKAGLPAINVSPAQGKLLQLLSRVRGATKILEVGTLGGYSTIWLARALPPGGKLVTLEYEPKHAAVAQKNIERAQLSGMVEIRIGKAIETLPQLEAEGSGPFDLVFIDADKPSTADYFQWALRLTRPGSLIIVDNVVRKGKVIDAASEDENVRGVRRFLELAKTQSCVSGTAIQTVGIKGYDGLAILLVTGPEQIKVIETK